MQLTRQKKPSAVVGLEIEAGSLAAAEVRVNGTPQLGTAAIEQLPAGAFRDGEVVDADALSDGLKSLFTQHKLSKRVRLGIANQGVLVRTVRLPAIEDPKELDAAVRFQAQEQMPMPLDQAVLEHQVVGGVPAEEGAPPQIDVVLVAARREMINSFLRPLRRAGLEPVGVDLSAFGMIRALADEVVRPELVEGELQRPAAAVLYCSVGDVTNLAVARGRSCLFTRASHAGFGPVAEGLATSRGLSNEHAGMWLDHVGMEKPLEEIEGDPEVLAAARQALEAGLSAIVDELRLSLDYYGAQEAAVPIERVVLCGPGSTIDGMASRMEAGLGLPIQPARPQALGGLDDRSAARLTLPFGLALER
ncbi:MAG: pilM [Solirubrobacterales bacterium]|nr:pilM [Solirubrobacterales bacterium]